MSYDNIDTVELTSGLGFEVERTEIEAFNSRKPDKKSKVVTSLYLILGCLSVALVLTFTFKFMFSPTLISGSSMTPTLKDGEVWLSTSKSFKEPRVGDIIRAYSRDDMVTVVKRVVATTGDTVKIKDSGLYVNNKLVDNSAETSELTDNSTSWVSSHLNKSYTLEKDEYFVLGDNRNNSKDSRYYGTILRKDVQTTLTNKAPTWIARILGN